MSFDQTSTVKAFLSGGNKVLLRPTDYVASGGEGVVYRKGGDVFKLYLEPAEARARGIEEKIKLLSQIKHPAIIAPKECVYDELGQALGYTMDFCTGAPLVKTFANSWRDQNGFGDKESATLVENMRLALEFVHAGNVLLIDGNEMNYLADGVNPKLIDVDSWQVGRFKASVQMPSIRDWSTKTFTEFTDWFAWAIVTFQVFTGIHPYKGTHPDFKKGDMEARMKANASVFDPKVKVNSAVRDFSCIPTQLRNWYEQTLQSGERVAPPSVSANPIAAAPKKHRTVQTASSTISHQLLMTLDFDVQLTDKIGLAYGIKNGEWVAYDMARQKKLVIRSASIKKVNRGEAALMRFEDRYAYIKADNGEIRGSVIVAEGEPEPVDTLFQPLPVNATSVSEFGSLYAMTETAEKGLVELGLRNVGKNMVYVVKSWPMSSNSATMYDGLFIYDALGTPYAVIPSRGQSHQLPLIELRGRKIVNAFARNSSFVVVIAIDRATGALNRLVFTKLPNATHLTLLSQDIVDDTDLNIVVTPKGIAVAILEDDQISVFNTNNNSSRAVQAPGLAANTKLFMVNDMVCYAVDSRIFQLSLR